MSGKDLFEGMSYVDERFVDEAENKSFPKRIVSPWIKVASMAACLCLIIFSLYNLQPYLRGETEGITGEGAMLEGAIEDSLEQEYGVSPAESPTDGGAPRVPDMMIRIQEVTETGFVGIVQNDGGFTMFEDGTIVIVAIDSETDPDFTPENYQIGDLVQVMYTQWDVVDQTIVASIVGIVDEPIRD